MLRSGWCPYIRRRSSRRIFIGLFRALVRKFFSIFSFYTLLCLQQWFQPGVATTKESWAFFGGSRIDTCWTQRYNICFIGVLDWGRWFAIMQCCSNVLARGPHLSFRNPSQTTRINNLVYQGKLCCILTLLND